MANKRDLKRNINNVLGDILDAVVLMEGNAPTKESEAIIDDAISTFDNLIAKVNAKDIADKKSHFKGINTELETQARELIDRLNKLS
jgi:hypothetical protein